MNNMQEYMETAEKVILKTYNRFPMVLEKGEIIERGTHDDLLEMKGRYYELYTGKKELD